MELPVTREQLQNYNIYYPDVMRRKRLDEIANQIYTGIQQVVLQKRDTKFSYIIRRDLLHLRVPNSSTTNTLTVEEVIEFLIGKFIECTIQTDPLKTYILIDWS